MEGAGQVLCEFCLNWTLCSFKGGAFAAGGGGVNGFYEFLLNVSFGAPDKQYKNAQAIVRICPHVAKPKTAKCQQAAVLDTPETDNKSGD